MEVQWNRTCFILLHAGDNYIPAWTLRFALDEADIFSDACLYSSSLTCQSQPTQAQPAGEKQPISLLFLLLSKLKLHRLSSHTRTPRRGICKINGKFWWVFFFFFFISVTMRHFKCLGSTILWHGDEIEIGVCKYYFLFSGHRTTVLISLPVNTQSTQTQHSNSNRGFLYEGHKFAQHKTKWPIFCYELQKQTNIKKKQGHYHKQRREQTIFEK